MTWGDIALQLLTFAPSGTPMHVIHGYMKIAYDAILSHRRWRRLDTEGLLFVKGPFMGGTVAVTGGLATVTLTGATWTSALDQFKFRTDGSTEWYRFTWLTATTGELDRAYEGETAAAIGYRLFQNEYELPDDWRSVKSITNPRLGVPLSRKSHEWMMANDPQENRFGSPVYFNHAASTTDPAKQRIRFFPTPDADLTLPHTYRTIVEGFDESDMKTSPLPWISAGAIIAHAKAAIALELKKDPVAAGKLTGSYASALNDMKLEDCENSVSSSVQLDPYYLRTEL